MSNQYRRAQIDIYKKFILVTLVLLVTLFMCVGIRFCFSEEPPDSEIDTNQEVNKLGNEGLTLIQRGNWDEGLQKIKEATQLAPKNPTWHMNYASMLLIKGKSVFDAGNKQEARAIYDEVTKELFTAIDLFKIDDNKILIAHCYFLLGDVYSNIFADNIKAEEFYRSALEFDPQNNAAASALRKLQSH
jgi:tetratricopeptide (TPR) repeat protein